MSRTAARAIAWQLARRHRAGLAALVSGLACLAAIKVLVPSALRAGTDTPERFALLVAVPCTSACLWSLAVFSFGLDGDLAGRRSIYPPRMFTLPLSNAALAGLPMALGTGFLVALWIAARLAVPWPPGTPTFWPALLLAALLSWTQALTWMPYGLRGARVVASVLVLSAMDAVVLTALHLHVSEAWMAAGLAAVVPLAYLVALRAVTRARRGEVPDWGPALARLAHVADVVPRRTTPFRSPVRAQIWFEWRRQGRSLPALVALVLPFELALLVLARADHPRLALTAVAAALVTPPVLATFAAMSAKPSSPGARDAYELGPFVATRPLTSRDLVAARLVAAAAATLAAWLVVIAALVPSLALSGAWRVVLDRAQRLAASAGTLRAVTVALLVIFALVLSTWKRLVQSLYVGLSGRAWVVKASTFLTLSFFCALGPLVRWIVMSSDAQAALFAAVPWVLALLAAAKTFAACAVASKLARGPLVSGRDVAAGAALWLGAVLALHGVLVWLAGTPLVASHLLAFAAILEIPFVRVAAATPALAWNRHR